LRQGKGLSGLVPEFVGNSDATKGGLGVKDSDADIAGDIVG
jgi:hypothetical protein